ncbi:hypothetical protein PTT_18099 [Pyrenophora teres f. teres 0-1]|uniref:Uncharacterized protein n=1 Tax=Pyrenophora teres f. teres (strain 0-1) TaxID=861557 RepID=E3S5Y7_PYRTT|nr:hypothetical protein PTT_18099 [Pyrenophora teres f. teres 0-1]
MEEKLQKAQAKKQREEAQLQRQVELEEKRNVRAKLKLNTRQKLSNKLNNASAKPPQVAQPSNKRQERASAAQAGVQAGDELSAAPAKVTLRGRKINLPQNYR